MRTVVTGAAGFIGSHITEALLARGHHVTAVDDLSTGCRSNLPPTADLHQISVLDPALDQVCAGAGAVVHAAAQTSVAVSARDPAGDALTNIVGTIRAVRAAAGGGAQRFIYLSSAAVYAPDAQPPMGEDAQIGPASPYGISKLAGEWYVQHLAGAAGMEWVIVRLANVYGPRQSAEGEAGVIARWSAALAAGDPVILYGDGSQTRDFIYVEDVARAVAMAAEAGAAAGRLFNVGTGTETAIGELLGTLEGLAGARAAVIRRERRPGDPPRSALQTGCIRRALGWAPSVALAEGLARTLSHYLERP
ncbi:MAG TPA: NAD-dependent epimerase/dehydratase family protein [Symbiobacteriaceae bacterium]|nr:NAD-dependent epimerase/dehydratase family protein [Symbiobacteriaceae bacterium]